MPTDPAEPLPDEAAASAEPALLAVDLGVKTGLALYGRDGRLRWARSQNLGSVGRLKRAAPGLVAIPGLRYVIHEGDRALGSIWERAAARRDAACLSVTPEAWRERLLLVRERRSGARAKEHAERAAARVLAWSGVKGRRTLRHDAAEAVLIGLYGVLEVGWLEEVPCDLR